MSGDDPIEAALAAYDANIWRTRNHKEALSAAISTLRQRAERDEARTAEFEAAFIGADKAGGDVFQQLLAAQSTIADLNATLRHIAAITHCGGWRGIDPFTALNHVRRLSLPWLDKAAKPEGNEVDAAIRAALGGAE